VIAPEHLEPYGVRLLLRGDLADPPSLVARLLENVARRCIEAGASMIGHLKAHGRTAEGSFHCNLTSLRGGARCAGPQAEFPGTVSNLELDLAVLVYGLSRAVLAEATENAVTQLREAGVSEWSYRSEGADPRDAGHVPAHQAAGQGRVRDVVPVDPAPLPGGLDEGDPVS
jgi:hypothetical protein